MQLRFLLTSVFAGILFSAQAQQQATQASAVGQALQTKNQMLANSIVKNVPFTIVGPTIMSGRVVDI